MNVKFLIPEKKRMAAAGNFMMHTKNFLIKINASVQIPRGYNNMVYVA